MANIFDQHPPSRLRIDTGSTLAVDVVTPCFMAVYPDPAGSGQIQIAESHASPAQLVALAETVIRFSIIHGLMNEVLRSLTMAPLTAQLQSFPTLPPGTPPDDVPRHLRGPRNPGG